MDARQVHVRRVPESERMQLLCVHVCSHILYTHATVFVSRFLHLRDQRLDVTNVQNSLDLARRKFKYKVIVVAIGSAGAGTGRRPMATGSSSSSSRCTCCCATASARLLVIITWFGALCRARRCCSSRVIGSWHIIVFL